MLSKEVPVIMQEQLNLLWSLDAFTQQAFYCYNTQEVMSSSKKNPHLLPCNVQSAPEISKVYFCI